MEVEEAWVSGGKRLNSVYDEVEKISQVRETRQVTGGPDGCVLENEKGPGQGFLVKTLESLSCITGDDS